MTCSNLKQKKRQPSLCFYVVLEYIQECLLKRSFYPLLQNPVLLEFFMWDLSQTDQFFKTVETESICEVYEEEYFHNSTVKTLALSVF